ncbi:phytoene dehydrogenase-like protein [Jatrophihabitans sp. GAS493]|uniref:phytoene desaturase family protein n=1 Tax=Jatrophihabitans sp. GAS493 TaxID=1907575 RepID=UPI000BB92112|nr:NAD(P)/FAD-dependent oxidoreductase [Jatrophihabitans sp. GAS493]SOD72056.1 phytoene dehydrogenase-like protein [Jatrophihabitans sp. GAS493]
MDVVVAGGGHNGLVAAILAAQAGRSVLLLERSDHVGGAAVSAQVFAGRPARLSKYSYLVSLFPDELQRRLGVRVELRSRAVSSYTPLQRDGRATGLLVEREPSSATEASFRALTGSEAEWRAWQQLYSELAVLARVLAPGLTGELHSRSQARDAVLAAGGSRIWEEVVQAPVAELITSRFADDSVRGIVATDALIGTFTSLADESLLANRCFLYHLIGRGTGEWLVPVGGMGALSDALLTRALELGVEVRTGVEVRSVDEDAVGVTLQAELSGGGELEVRATNLLAAVAPVTIDRWRGRVSAAAPEGAQLKINMLLDRLPRLKSGIDPNVAFAGTTHFEEDYSQLEEAYRVAGAGEVPALLPAEIYCHSLTDPSILQGYPGHTLTLFGLHAPARLFAEDPELAKQRVTQAALASLQRHLAEPLEDCLARDENGWLCLDVATPVDVEQSVGMPGGHIFHGDLQWPWLDDDADRSTPAQRYGVAVADSERILIAGSGSRRGGAVSGLGGAAAVDALLATR